LVLRIYVEDNLKAAAIAKLLPMKKQFGNVSLYIVVIPANGKLIMRDVDHTTYKELFDLAFDGNPVYAFSHSVDQIFSNVITYIVFKNRVVQFFNDNLNDIYGNVSTLYQEIASDIFENVQGVCFCTDIEEKVGKPLGEWP